MNRREFLTRMMVAPVALPLTPAEAVEREVPASPEEWWAQPPHDTSGYGQWVEPDNLDGNPSHFTVTVR